MKKLFITILWVMAGIQCFAENFDEDDIWCIIPYVGLHTSTVKGDLLAGEMNWKFNTSAGGQIQVRPSGGFALLMDYNFRRAGAKVDYKEEYQDYYIDRKSEADKLTLDYHSIGLQTKFYRYDRLAFRIGIELMLLSKARLYSKTDLKIAGDNRGPFDGWSSKDDVSKYVWWTYHVKNKEDITSHFSESQLSIPIGLTYEYKRMVVNFTYHFNPKNCADEPIGHDIFGNSYGKRTLRNHSLDLTIGFKLNPLKDFDFSTRKSTPRTIK